MAIGRESIPKCELVCVSLCILVSSDSLRANGNDINPPFAPPALVFLSFLITRFLFNN